jgi:hypothetical protein
MFMQCQSQKPLYASRPVTICIELAITWHDLNLKLWILKISKNIFTMDLESCTKMSGVQWWKPFLNQMLRWVIIVKKGTKLEWTRACQHVSAHVSPCQVEQPARGEIFMRWRTGFDSLNHWFVCIVATKTFVRSLTWKFTRPICCVWRGLRASAAGWAG